MITPINYVRHLPNYAHSGGHFEMRMTTPISKVGQVAYLAYKSGHLGVGVIIFITIFRGYIDGL